MDFVDWWLFFLPVVFFAGWLIARLDMDQVVSRARAVPERVMEGIGALMAGDRKAAAEAFIDSGGMLQGGSTDLHFTAGELYRQHGDYERAIRIHKNMIDSPQLGEEARQRAKYELGLDYLQGGFIDLAEKCFSQLQGTRHANDCLRHLFNIHLHSRSWEQAIKDEERFAEEDRNVELHRNVIAQLHCEWADAEPNRKDELLAKALECDPLCRRARAMRAEQALDRGEHALALEELAHLDSSPHLIPLVADLVMKAHVGVGNGAAGERKLKEMFERHPSPLMFEKVFDAIAKERKAEELQDFGLEGMRILESPVVVAKWIESVLPNASGEQQAAYTLLLKALGDVHGKYACSSCGFVARNHYWQCPVCRSWETLAPQSGSVPAH